MPVGVTTRKKTKPITIGDTKLPNKIPNLNHNLFKGVRIDELLKPKIKKTIESIIAQILISPLLNNGNIEITKKTIKNTIPKLLFELFFISNFLSLIIFPLVTLCETIKIVQSIHS